MPGSLVIVNPGAARARGGSTLAALTERAGVVLARRDGSPPRLVETRSPNDVGALVDGAVAGDAPSIVAVGGDGTVRAVAAALAGTDVPMGVIPAGTGNQVAAVLGIPRSPLAAVDELARSQPRVIDLGLVTVRADGGVIESPFVIGCGAGLDGALMAATSDGLKRRLGALAYFVHALPLVARLSTTACRIELDDEVLELEATTVLVGNMGQLFPGRLDLRLPLDPTDGLLDLIVVGATGVWSGVRGLADQLRRTELGQARDLHSLRLRGRRIVVEPARSMPLEIDGDPAGQGSLEATIMPGAVQVLVPAT